MIRTYWNRSVRATKGLRLQQAAYTHCRGDLSCWSMDLTTHTSSTMRAALDPSLPQDPGRFSNLVNPAVQAHFGHRSGLSPGFLGLRLSEERRRVVDSERHKPSSRYRSTTSKSLSAMLNSGACPEIRVTESVSDVVATATAMLRGSIDAAARRWPLTLPLTAGVDSRTILAACRKHIANIAVYTLQLGGRTTPSREVQSPLRSLAPSGCLTV